MIKLYGHWRSSSSWRVRIALCYKNIPYELVPMRLSSTGSQKSEEFTLMNPMQQVPLLEVSDGNVVAKISQSIAIMEYLEERFPSPHILPKDIVERAYVRQVSEIINSGIQPLQNLSVKSYVNEILLGDDVKWTKHWIERGLSAIELAVMPFCGTFCLGDNPTMADICLVPQLASARRFGVSVDKYKKLLQIESNCEKLDSFIKAHADNQIDKT